MTIMIEGGMMGVMSDDTMIQKACKLQRIEGRWMKEEIEGRNKSADGVWCV